MKLTNRDRFFIKEAFKAGSCYDNAKQWLNEVLNNAGNVVEQSLACDAGNIVEAERAHMFLDGRGVLRHEAHTQTEYSLVGRIKLYKYRSRE